MENALRGIQEQKTDEPAFVCDGQVLYLDLIGSEQKVLDTC